MKYTKEIADKLALDYLAGATAKELSLALDVPEKSVIAKLSNMGVYKKKQYTTKRGEIPIKKESHIENIAKLLEVNVEVLESLEKVNKNVLVLLERKLTLNCSGCSNILP